MEARYLAVSFCWVSTTRVLPITLIHISDITEVDSPQELTLIHISDIREVEISGS